MRCRLVNASRQFSLSIIHAQLVLIQQGLPFYVAHMHPQKISGTSVKNHLSGDVEMAGRVEVNYEE